MDNPTAMEIALQHASEDRALLERLVAEGRVMALGTKAERRWFTGEDKPKINLAIRPKKGKRKR